MSVLASQAATVLVRDFISSAITQAHDGDTVLLQGPGVFYERVTLTKPIHLLGTNAPVLDAGGLGTPLTLSCSNCEVRGLAIRNSGKNLAEFDTGIMVLGNRSTIQDCDIENDAFGIYVRGAAETTIENNRIAGSTNIPSAARGNGIHLWKTERNRIVNNSIHDKRDGIYLSYANDNIISGNQVRNTRFGIHYMYSHQNRLTANSLNDNVVGATLMFSRLSLVQDNIVVGNRRHGLLLKQLDRSQIINNIVAGQNRGLFVQQATQNRFEGNLLATNDIGLYLSNCSEQNTFVGNAFIGNIRQVWQPPFETDQGRNAPNLFSENGRGNFWSDYTGADRDQNGIGDTPYHQTDVFGYILDRHPQARVLALSPAVALLRKGEELIPLLDTKGVTDPAPLMRPPRKGAGTGSSPLYTHR